MNHVNINAFYSLGGTFRSLAEIANYKRFEDMKGVLVGTRTMLARVLAGEFVPVARCAELGKKLDKEIESFLIKYESKGSDFIKQDDARAILFAAITFEDKLRHELDHLDVYYIPPKGTHATLALIEKAETNLPRDVVSRLEPKALNDIQQAGRCLALDAPTAAGFHILRAVESLIVRYIDKITGKPHPPKNRNWGAYIQAIRNNGGKPAVADYLFHMKETYRNPIMHPEVVLTPDEAFSLFNASLSAIVQLDKAIQDWP